MKTSEQIIKDVSNKEKIEGYNLLEMHLYLTIKQILKMYFNNQISKEEAVKYKQQAVKEYEMNKKDYEFQQSMFKEHIKTYASTEMLRTKLRKKLKDDEPITEQKLSETINICLQILQIVFKEQY